LVVFFISFLDFFNIVTSNVVLIRSLILTVALIVEGFLFGFQIWFLKEVCYFCLTVFLLVFSCFIVDFFLQKNYSFFVAGVCGFLGVYLATFFVHINVKPINLSNPALIYEPGCPHCERVMKFAESKNIPLNAYPVSRVLGLIRTLGINTVPDLIYTKGHDFYILNGEDEIVRWLEKNYLKGKKRRTKFVKKDSKDRGVQTLFRIGNELFEPSSTITPKACELNHTCK